MPLISKKHSKDLKIALIFAVVFILIFISKQKEQHTSSALKDPNNPAYSKCCANQKINPFSPLRSTCNLSYKSKIDFKNTHSATISQKQTPITTTQSFYSIIELCQASTCPNQNYNTNTLHTDAEFSNIHQQQDSIETNTPEYEQPEHREFYLKIREHVICFIVYALIAFFWFSLFRKAQKNSQSKLISYKFFQNSLKPKLKSSSNNLHSSADDTTTKSSPTQALDTNLVPIQSTNLHLPTIELTSSLEQPIQNKSIRKIRRKSSVAIDFFGQKCISNSTTQKLLDVELETFRNILIEDNTELNFAFFHKQREPTTNLIPNYNRIDPLISAKFDPAFVFGSSGNQFYIQKRAKSQPILIKKSFRRKELVKKRSNVFKDQTIPPLSPAAAENNYYSNPRRIKSIDLPSPKTKVNSKTYETFNPKSQLQNLFDQRSPAICVPFWFRAIPSFTASIGMTLVSMQIALLITTIVMTNIMELSQVSSLKITNPTNQANTHYGAYMHQPSFPTSGSTAKISFKNWFLPPALAPYRFQISDQLNNNKLFGLDLHLDHDANQARSVTESDYPDVLVRFWQYQSIMTQVALCCLFPFIWLLLKSHKYRNPRKSIAKSQRLLDVSITGKRQRDLLSNNNKIGATEPYFSFNHPFVLKTLVINWNYVIAGMFIWYIFLVVIYQALTGIQSIAVGFIGAYYMDFKKPPLADLPTVPNLIDQIKTNQQVGPDTVAPAYIVLWQYFFRFVISLSENTLTLQQFHFISIATVLPLVLFSSPLGVLNQIWFLSFIFPISKNQVQEVLDANNRILKIQTNLESLANLDSSSLPNFETHTQVARKKISFSNQPGTKFAEPTYRPIIKNPSALDTLEQSSLFTINKSIIPGSSTGTDIYNFKTFSNNERSGTVLKKTTQAEASAISDFQFTPQNSFSDVTKEINGIKNLLLSKQSEIYSSKIVKRPGPRKSFFWSSPILRYLVFLLLSGLCLLCWLMLVLQSVHGLLNAAYMGDMDINMNLSDPKHNLESLKMYKNDDGIITKGFKDGSILVSSPNFNLYLTGSILISVFNIVVLVYLFTLTICGVYKPSVDQISIETKNNNTINGLNENLSNSTSFSALKQLGFDLQSVKRILNTKIKRVSDIEWESLYLLKILMLNKNSNYYSFDGKRVVSHVFLLLFIISAWPTMLRTINIIPKHAYSLTISPLATKSIVSDLLIFQQNQSQNKTANLYSHSYLAARNVRFQRCATSDVQNDALKAMLQERKKGSSSSDSGGATHNPASASANTNTNTLSVSFLPKYLAGKFRTNLCYSSNYIIQKNYHFTKSNQKRFSVNGVSAIFWVILCEPGQHSIEPRRKLQPKPQPKPQTQNQSQYLKQTKNKDKNGNVYGNGNGDEDGDENMANSRIRFTEWGGCSNTDFSGELHLVNNGFPIKHGFAVSEKEKLYFQGIGKLLLNDEDQAGNKDIVYALGNALSQLLDLTAHSSSGSFSTTSRLQRLISRFYRVIKRIITFQRLYVFKLLDKIYSLRLQTNNNTFQRNVNAAPRAAKEFGDKTIVSFDDKTYKKYQQTILEYASAPLIYSPGFWLSMQQSPIANSLGKSSERVALERLDQWLKWISSIDQSTNRVWQFKTVLQGGKEVEIAADVSRDSIICQLQRLAIAYLGTFLNSGTAAIRKRASQKSVSFSSVFGYIYDQIILKTIVPVALVVVPLWMIFATKQEMVVSEIVKLLKPLKFSLERVSVRKLALGVVSIAALSAAIKYFDRVSASAGLVTSNQEGSFLATIVSIPSSLLDIMVYVTTYFSQLKNFKLLPLSVNQDTARNPIPILGPGSGSGSGSQVWQGQGQSTQAPVNAQTRHYLPDIATLEMELTNWVFLLYRILLTISLIHVILIKFTKKMSQTISRYKIF